ncbi:hypothetical protein AB1Y20_018437 [Prymnesium parvum]|uniref:Uncharacterized protein n=1 Tax=Prymnesium parvum TaxID=97485 RepID=A0AB34JND8_PRYPA
MRFLPQCLLTLALAFPSAETHPSSAHGLLPGSVYAGHYVCGSPAWLLLHIEAADAAAVDAIFHFVYPRSTLHGAFSMRGSFSSDLGRLLLLTPREWIHRPPGKVVPIGLAGLVSADGARIAGEVLHSGCGSFELNRTAIDGAPAAFRLGEAKVRLPEGASPAADGREELRTLIDVVDQLIRDVREAQPPRAEEARLPLGAEADEAAGHASAERRQLVQMLRRQQWDAAYSTWRQLPPAEQHAAMRAVVPALSRLDLHASARLQHDAIRALSVFGGQPLVCGAIASLRAADARLVAFAEGQLHLALNRSGLAEADRLLEGLDRQLAALATPAAGGRERAAVMATLARLEAVAPRWAHAAFRRGELLAAAGDHKGCVAQQRRALELNEHHLPAMLQLAICYKELNDVAQALSTFLQLRGLHPSMAGLKRFKQWISFAAEQQQKVKAKKRSSRVPP